jgi:hypothetical protein
MVVIYNVNTMNEYCWHYDCALFRGKQLYDYIMKKIEQVIGIMSWVVDWDLFVYIIKASKCCAPLVMVLIIVYEDLWFLGT